MSVNEITRRAVGHRNDGDAAQPRKLGTAADCFIVRVGRYAAIWRALMIARAGLRNASRNSVDRNITPRMPRARMAAGAG
jgi:hypothetical protein